MRVVIHDRLTRRVLIRRGFGFAATISAGSLLAGCSAAAPDVLASAAVAATPIPSLTPLPPPETATIRLTAAPCCSPLFAAERFLRDEGFTDVQISDAGAIAALTSGKADMGQVFATGVVSALDSGKAVIGLAGVHAGCVEVWAPASVSSLKDLKGHTVVVKSRAVDDNSYSYLAIALKQAGVDVASVNWVVQSDADLTKAFLDGKSDALTLLTTNAFAFHSNTANKGHLVFDQAMEDPWSGLDCCIITTTPEWLRANPIAARRALRAIYRAADSLPNDRADAAKLATDKGLFGGAKNVEIVRGAANMVSLDWRKLDAAKSIRFHAELLGAVGLAKIAPDVAVSSGLDMKTFAAVRTDLPNP